MFLLLLYLCILMILCICIKNYENSNFTKQTKLLKHEEHPFHILPPSYLPFIVALIAGMFVATFAFLMHKDVFKRKQFHFLIY